MRCWRRACCFRWCARGSRRRSPARSRWPRWLPVSPQPVPAARPIPWSELALAAAGLGRAGRLAWLAAGFCRLRRYRRAAAPLEPGCAWSTEAELLLSADVASPVTFGWRKARDPVARAFPGVGRRHARRHPLPRDPPRAPPRLAFRGRRRAGARRLLVPSRHLVAAGRDSTGARAGGGPRSARDDEARAILISMRCWPWPARGPSWTLAPAPLFLRKRHLKQRVMGILEGGEYVETAHRRLAGGRTGNHGRRVLVRVRRLPIGGRATNVFDGPGVTRRYRTAPTSSTAAAWPIRPTPRRRASREPWSCK